MKRALFCLLFLPFLSFAQVGPNITSWKINTTNHIGVYYSTNSTSVISTGDTSEVQQVCYNTDTVWVRANILASYTMGPWPGDPFVVDGQNNSYVFPRNPAYPSSNHPSVPVGMLGMAVNGVALFTDGDSQSYSSSLGANTMTGSGVWNTIAWKAHLSEMDAGNAHPDPSSTYHHHHNPIMLASVTNSTAHSPIIGYAFDGNPIYGPFGYSVSTSSTSPIKRMTSSWSLRSISTRTALYTGTVTSQVGPNVSTQFPLGTYIEDYGYTANSGDLDFYNGRYCVTPEYPNGTYAYFLNTDANGNPQYPNMVGPNFYGSIYLTNYGPNGGSASAPKIGKTCYTPSSSLTATITSTGSVSCYGQSTGSAVITASGGSTSKTYSWLPSGGTTSVAINLSAGNYTCIVTSGTLSVSKTVSILQSSEITYTASTTNILCNGASTGGASLQVSGGSPAYTYSWSNSSTSQNISNLTAGTYTFKITDNKGCVKTNSVTLTQPTSSLALSFVTSGATCSSGGSVDLTVTGGTSPYSYSWTSGATSQDLNNVTAGSYSVTVTDAGGCTKTGVTSVTTSASSPTLSALVTSVICNGASTGSVNLTATGSTSYSYLWSNSATSEDITGLAAGVYTVAVTGANGCISTLTATIAQPSAITTTITGSNIACTGASTGSITLLRSGGTSPYTYLWSNSSTSQNLNGVQAGSYTVVVTDASGCTKQASVTLSQPASSLVVSATGNSINCNGASTGSASMTVTGGNSPYSYLWSNNATASSISSVVAGSYTGTVTDANGCIKSATIAITQPTSGMVLTLSSSSVGCSSGSTGSIGLTVTGGTSPYSYLWSNSATTQNATSLASGSYTVLVTDAAGCTKTGTASVSQSTASAISTTVTTGNVKCYGQTTGTVNLILGGGTAPFSFLWNNSATTRSLTNLAAGNYTVLITDAQGCTKTQTVAILQPTAALAVAANVTSLNCNGASTGSISLTVTGGIAPYTYSWSTSSTSQSITSLSAGSYTALVTDANTCTISTVGTISQPSAISINSVITNVTCFGNSTGAVSTTITGGTTPYTYSWSNSASTQNISSLTAGTYTLNLVDFRGCIKTSIATITQPSSVAVTVNTASLACFGSNTGTIGLTVNGGTAPYTYSWSNSATSQTIGSLAAGNYSVLVTDALGCTRTATTSVLSPLALSTTVTAINVLCNGASTGSVNLVVSGGNTPYSYNWSNSSTSQNLNSVAAGNYTVTVTDNRGCVKTATATITQPSASISISSTQNSVNCFGGSTGTIGVVASGGSGPYTYLWSNSVTTQTVGSLIAGNYSVIVTDASGCTRTYSTLILQSASITPVVTTTSISCLGGTNGSASLTVSGGTAPYTYSWSTNASASTVSSLSAGNYTFTVTDGLGCVKSGTINIAQPGTSVTANTSVTNVSCFGSSNGSVGLTVSGGTSPYTYTWSTNANSQSITGLVAGTYSVNIKDANGCQSVKSATVTQPASLTVQATTFSVNCFGASTGSIALITTGGTSPYTYLWSNSSTASVQTGLSAGNFTVQVTDANGCVKTQTTTVSQSSAISGTLNTTAITCNGANNGAINLVVSGGTGSYTYVWNNSATSASLTNLAAGNYSVNITDGLGCIKSLTVALIEPSQIQGTLTIKDAKCYGASTGSVTVSVQGGTPAYTYSWSNGVTTTSLTNVVSGGYTLVVTDNNGCTKQFSATVSQPSSITITGTVSNATAGTNGSVSLSVNGGISPYGYTWSNGNTSANLSGVGPGTYTVSVVDGNNCQAQSVFTVDAGVGIRETTFKGLTVYPNPVTEVLYLEWMEELEFKSCSLLDMNGRVVYSSDQKISQIQMSDYNKGIYTLQIITDKGVIIERVIRN